MYCPNCGSKVDDNAVYCDTCGTNLKAENAAPVEEQIPAAQPTVEQPYTEPAPVSAAAPTYEMPGEPENNYGIEPPAPKKSHKKVIVGVILAAIVLVLGFIFRGFLLDVFMMIMPAETQLKYAYAKELNVYSDVVLDVYDDFKDVAEGKKQTANGSFKVTMEGAALKELVDQDLPDMEVSGEYKVAKTTDAIMVEMKLKANGEEIEGTVGMDLAEKLITADVPALCEEPMVLDLEDLVGEEILPDNLAEALIAFAKMLPTSDQLEKVLTKTVKAALDTLESVNKDKEEYTAGDVTAIATCYSIEFSEETMVEMAKAVLESLREDKTLKKYVISLYKAPEKLKDCGELADQIEDLFDEADISSGDDIYELLTDALDEALDSMDDDVSDETLFTINTYMNGMLEMTAIEIKVGEMATVMIGKAKSGREVGYEISYNIKGQEDAEFYLGGTGTESLGKFTGELTLSVEGKTYATVECEKADIDGLIAGECLKGEFTITEKISGFDLDIEVVADCTADKAKLKVDASVVAVEIDQKIKNGAKINLPKDGLDMEDWSEEAIENAEGVVTDMFGDIAELMSGAEATANAESVLAF